MMNNAYTTPLLRQRRRIRSSWRLPLPVLLVLLLLLPVSTTAIRGSRRRGDANLNRHHNRVGEHLTTVNERNWSTRFLQNANKDNGNIKEEEDKDANKNNDKDINNDKDNDKDNKDVPEEEIAPTLAPTTLPTQTPVVLPEDLPTVESPPVDEEEEESPTTVDDEEDTDTSGGDVGDDTNPDDGDNIFGQTSNVDLQFSLVFLRADNTDATLTELEDTWTAHISQALAALTCTTFSQPRVQDVCTNNNDTNVPVVPQNPQQVQVVRQGTVDVSWTRWQTTYSIVNTTTTTMNNADLQTQWQQALNLHMVEFNDNLNNDNRKSELLDPHHHTVTLVASPVGRETEFFAPEALTAALQGEFPFVTVEEPRWNPLRISGILLFLATAVCYALLVRRSESRRKVLIKEDANYDASKAFRSPNTSGDGEFGAMVASPSGQEIVWKNEGEADFLPASLHTSVDPDTSSPKSRKSPLSAKKTARSLSGPAPPSMLSGRVSPLPEPDCGSSVTSTLSNLLPNIMTDDEIKDDDDYQTPSALLLSFFSSTSSSTGGGSPEGKTAYDTCDYETEDVNTSGDNNGTPASNKDINDHGNDSQR